jgi:AraC-like DNA-binding protein
MAKECGFNSTFSFRRAFLKEYGILPGEYFRNMKK